MVTAPDPLCELSDLPASMCGCAKHRGGTEPAEEIRTIGQPFEAAYAGHCDRCDGRIKPGEDIVRKWDVGETQTTNAYVHAGRCPR